MGEDIHEEIKNSIFCKLLHVPVRLPLLSGLVHMNGLLQGLGDSKNQKSSTENKSWECSIQVQLWWDIDEGTIAIGEISGLHSCD